MPASHPDFPALRCSVFAATDIRATLGASAGDPVAAADAVSLGDVYRLRSGARALQVALCPAPGAARGAAVQRIAESSELGQPGDEIDIAARLTMMAGDGQTIDLLVLRHRPATGAAGIYATPLTPMSERVDYTLIRAEADPGDLRLIDVACASFGAGTRITLPDGRQQPIERLAPGDLVLTRDHGAQPLRWNAKAALRAIGSLAPVVIPAGAMGNAGALILSQRHRLFLYDRNLARITGMPETLVEARHLVGAGDIHLRVGGYVDYHALIFDRHEIIYAEGIPVESLLVADTTIDTLPPDMARQLRDRFPGLNQPQHFGQEIDADLLKTPGRRRRQIGE
jgi:hypothetical protein